MQNKVRFKIGEIEFEAEGDTEVIARERNEFVTTLLPLAVDAMTKIINRQIPQITALPQSTTIDDIDLPQETDNLSKTSLASFIKQKGAESHTDFVLCAMFFKEKKKEMTSFSSATAKHFFSEAKKPLPVNISDLTYQLVKRGLIMESPSAKGVMPTEYVLTSKGEEYVNQLRPGLTKARKTSSKPRKQKKTT
jgi:hypothetical protein